MEYYTIDDVRLGYGRSGWCLRCFDRLHHALTHYRSLPASGWKILGLTDGLYTLDLVCCRPLLPGDREGENVLAAYYRDFPYWRDVPEAAKATAVCKDTLRLRYLLREDCIIPIPTKPTLPKQLRGVRLRSSEPENGGDSTHWCYVVSEGLIPAALLKRSRPMLPLVLHYYVECVAEDGAIFTTKVTPWEYEQLVHCTKEYRAASVRNIKTE